jgi:hypothetical protein
MGYANFNDEMYLKEELKFHPISYPVGTEGSYPGVKRPGCEADHSPPTSAEVKKIWIYTFTTPYALML